VDDSTKRSLRSSRRVRAEAPAFRSASLRALRAVEAGDVCSVCGERIEGEGPAEAGVDGSLAWSRGERVDVERVRQCESCAAGIAFTMQRRFEDEDDGG
jgi:hypothetical protein